MIEAAGRNGSRVRQEAFADLLDHRHAVIRVDDLLSDSKSHRNLLKQTVKNRGAPIIEKTLEKLNFSEVAPRPARARFIERTMLTAIIRSLPEWRNGRRRGLKIPRPLRV